MRTFELELSLEFRVNHPRGLRQRLAQALCRFAGWLDGRQVFAVDVISTPDLPGEYTRRSIVAGLRVGRELISEAVKNEALEQALLHYRPELFEQD